MPGPTKKLFIRSQDLGVHATLTLAFGSNANPVDWKVTRFGAHGYYSFEGTFNAQLGPAFIKAQPISDDTAEPASTYVPIDFREQTTLTTVAGNPPLYSFSVPERDDSIEADEFKVINNTYELQDIGIGFFFGPVTRPPTISSTETVIHGSSYRAKVNPMLSLYITDVQDPQGLAHDPAEPVWQRSLASLENTSYWVLTYADETFELSSDLTLGNPPEVAGSDD